MVVAAIGRASFSHRGLRAFEPLTVLLLAIGGAPVTAADRAHTDPNDGRSITWDINEWSTLGAPDALTLVGGASAVSF